MPGAKTFEEFWELETQPGEDVAVIQEQIVQRIFPVPGTAQAAAIATANLAATMHEAFRKVAWLAWLDGRLGGDSQTASHDKSEKPKYPVSPGEVVYVTTDPRDVKRKLAALGRTVSKLMIASNQTDTTCGRFFFKTAERLTSLEQRAQRDEEFASATRLKIDEMVQRLDEVSESTSGNVDELLLRIRNLSERVGEEERRISLALRSCAETRQAWKLHMHEHLTPKRQPRRKDRHGRK